MGTIKQQGEKKSNAAIKRIFFFFLFTLIFLFFLLSLSPLLPGNETANGQQGPAVDSLFAVLRQKTRAFYRFLPFKETHIIIHTLREEEALPAWELNYACFAYESSPHDVAPSLTNRFHEGYRAITIDVDAAASTAHTLQPGSEIALYAKLPESLNQEQTVGEESFIPVLEDAVILSTEAELSQVEQKTAQALETEEEQPWLHTVLTIQVAPERVALLRLAESQGHLIVAAKDHHSLPQQLSPSPLHLEHSFKDYSKITPVWKYSPSRVQIGAGR